LFVEFAIPSFFDGRCLVLLVYVVVVGEVFAVVALQTRSYERAVFVFVRFAYGLDAAVLPDAATVLGGDLQAVDEDPGTVRVDAVSGEGDDDVGERSQDGVGIFELRQELDEGRRLAGFARWALLVALIVVEVAEVAAG
jgi:hypothetical protein